MDTVPLFFWHGVEFKSACTWQKKSMIVAEYTLLLRIQFYTSKIFNLGLPPLIDSVCIHFIVQLFFYFLIIIFYRKLIDWSRIFRLMLLVETCLLDFVQSSTNNSLFSSDREALDKLISQSKERVNVIGFQGRLLGFQVCHLRKNERNFRK